MTQIKGKTVLLTGASRGIGLFIARELALRNANLVCVAQSSDRLAQAVREIEAFGGRAIGIPFDLSQVNKLPDLLEQIKHQTSSIDILINNAGIEIYKAFPDYSLAEIESILSVNLLAAMELTRLLLPNMLNRDSCHIVNIASLAGKKGHPYDSVYSASKAGLIMWADAIRQELFNTNVKISTICPGYIVGQGMLADTGLPAPSGAGTSTPTDVAVAVVRAIEKNQAEVIVNCNLITKYLTQFLLAIGQFFPRFGDAVNQQLKVTQLNQMRTKQQKATKSLLKVTKKNDY